MSRAGPSQARVYLTPAAVVAMGALWMWGGLEAPFRGAILFCAGVVLLSIWIGARSAARTRRTMAEHERQLRLLREGGLDALREDLARTDKGKDAA